MPVQTVPVEFNATRNSEVPVYFVYGYLSCFVIDLDCVFWSAEEFIFLVVCFNH